MCFVFCFLLFEVERDIRSSFYRISISGADHDLILIVHFFYTCGEGYDCVMDCNRGLFCVKARFIRVCEYESFYPEGFCCLDEFFFIVVRENYVYHGQSVRISI